MQAKVDEFQFLSIKQLIQTKRLSFLSPLNEHLIHTIQMNEKLEVSYAGFSSSRICQYTFTNVFRGS